MVVFKLFCLSIYYSICLAIFLSFLPKVKWNIFISSGHIRIIALKKHANISVQLWTICLSVFLPFCLSDFLSFCLSVFLSFCLSVFLPFCLSVLLSFCLSYSLSFCPSCLPEVKRNILISSGHIGIIALKKDANVSVKLWAIDQPDNQQIRYRIVGRIAVPAESDVSVELVRPFAAS